MNESFQGIIMEYNPHNWVVVKITTPDTTMHKIWAGWGYEEWRCSSIIKKVTIAEAPKKATKYLKIETDTGSIYNLKYEWYGLSGISQGAYENLQEKLKQQHNTVMEYLFEDEAIKYLESLILTN
jgi:hypothetical protein